MSQGPVVVYFERRGFLHTKYILFSQSTFTISTLIKCLSLFRFLHSFLLKILSFISQQSACKKSWCRQQPVVDSPGWRQHDGTASILPFHPSSSLLLFLDDAMRMPKTVHQSAFISCTLDVGIVKMDAEWSFGGYVHVVVQILNVRRYPKFCADKNRKGKLDCFPQPDLWKNPLKLLPYKTPSTGSR